jgi:maltooligosyltrehalose trehalohydrolase
MLVDFERVKLASAAVLLAPYIPMLFMGEEYADQSPFYYFVSHSDKDLIKAVQEGRQKEFEAFGFDENIPDPQDEKTFNQCKLRWKSKDQGQHQQILNWHRELIQMRKTLAPLKNFQKRDVRAEMINEKAFVLFRPTADMEEKLVCFFNFSETSVFYSPLIEKEAHKLLDSKDGQWTSIKKIDTHPDKIQPGENISLLPLSAVVYTSS